MFKNYLIVAARNFARNKVFSMINVLGLALGISAALVIFIIVSHEFSFDKFEKDQDRIFRVVINTINSGQPGYSAGVPASLGIAVQNDMTGVRLSVPIFQFQGDATTKVAIGTGNIQQQVVYKKQPDIVFTSAAYFDMIPYQWLAGSPQTALKDPFSVVLTESRARQYFPTIPVADVPGHTIVYSDSLRTTVSGVVKDLDVNTYFTFKEFISFPTILQTQLKGQFMFDVWNDWMGYSQLFVKLDPGNNPQAIESKMEIILEKYNKDITKDKNNRFSFHLQPLSNMHFNSDYRSFKQRIASKTVLYGLLAIASFLVLLSCINFINLTTAQASRRSTEIGIRKTMGGGRGQLIAQFLSETFFIALIAMILALALTPVLLKMFADFIPPDLKFNIFQQLPRTAVFLVLLIIIVSFLAGFYPALVLSGYRPIQMLNNRLFSTGGQAQRSLLRKILIISQFIIANFFIINTFVVSRQIHYTINKDFGFRKDAILYFETPFDTTESRRYALLNEIQSLTDVKTASLGFLPPASEGAAFSSVKYSNGREDLQPNVQIRWGDTNYLKLYDIKLLAGRNVQPSDTIREFIVNETYAHIMGFTNLQDVLGKHLKMNDRSIPIVGVMRDFHQQSLQHVIGPLVYTANNGQSYGFHVLLNSVVNDDPIWQRSVAKIENAFKKIYPDADFDYSFFDDTIAGFYKSDEDSSRLLKWASMLSIFISCIGLLGLTTYMTRVRTKEIGLRKILGASVSRLIYFLSIDFLKLVGIAFLISVPIAWFTVHKWLEQFPYRITFYWWIFPVSGLCMLAIALITISFQTTKAALANPANSLRTT